MPKLGNAPATGLQLHSTVGRDALLTLELAEVPVRPPNPDEVVVRMEAAPINPSDMMTMLASADVARARFSGTASRPQVSAPLAAADVQSRSRRIDKPLTVGLEGAGTVISTGTNVGSLLGRPVALLSTGAGTFAQYVTLPAAECVPIPEQLTVRDCAALFVNPLTALAIAETTRLEGEKALIHTAAASNLGQMLVKICLEDGLDLVNIVRRPQQVALLSAMGARHVCDSSAPTFSTDLIRAIDDTGARLVFDAIGGGSTMHQILSAIESTAAAKLEQYSPYGSSKRKQAFVYGHLDPMPLYVQQDNYGMGWALESWVMPSILARIGTERNVLLRQRIIDGAITTFAARFTREVSLAEALQAENLQTYVLQATGQKFLICPQR